MLSFCLLGRLYDYTLSTLKNQQESGSEASLQTAKNGYQVVLVKQIQQTNRRKCLCMGNSVPVSGIVADLTLDSVSNTNRRKRVRPSPSFATHLYYCR